MVGYMKIPRAFRPNEDTLLFHYCSPETLLAICSGKRLRFCDVFSMNDYMEMHWGYRVWERVASNLLPSLGKDFLDRIDEVISTSGTAALPLAACLSTHGDTLSQWRAYSQDGMGFSVGFHAQSLMHLPMTPLIVSYDEAQQIEEITQFTEALHDYAGKHPEDEEGFFQRAFKVGVDLCAYKNPAFREEGEVRFVHLVRFDDEQGAPRLVDVPPLNKTYEIQPVKFFMKQGSPVPHLDIPFLGEGGTHPIRKVIIGPKNQSLPSAVAVMLETLGLDGVEVVRSSASYR